MENMKYHFCVCVNIKGIPFGMSREALSYLHFLDEEIDTQRVKEFV